MGVWLKSSSAILLTATYWNATYGTSIFWQNIHHTHTHTHAFVVCFFGKKNVLCCCCCCCCCWGGTTNRRRRSYKGDTPKLILFVDSFYIFYKSTKMATIPVKIKWNKQQFDDVELDLSGDVQQFKMQLYSLTGEQFLHQLQVIKITFCYFFPCRCARRSTEIDVQRCLDWDSERRS